MQLLTSSMMSSRKKSFFLQFMLYFSAVLIILGIIQATIGTMRLYNASEQDYEKLAPEKVYTVPEIKKPAPNTTKIQETQKEIIHYVAEDKNPTIIPSSEKSQPPVIKTEPKKSEKKPPQEKQVTSPIEISVTPKKETAPQGYQETIWTVITGKYFRDALWKFPIIIDTKRVEPR